MASSKKKPPRSKATAARAPILSRTRVIWLLLAGAPLLFLGDLFLTGRIFLLRDTFCDLAPMQKFASDSFLSGVFPFWCPYAGMGKPFVGDFFPGVYYLPHVVFLFFSVAGALKLSWLFHFWIALFGAYYLGRSFRLSRGASVVAAWSFTFGAWTIAFFEYLNAFSALAWAPLTLGLVVRFLAEDQNSHLGPLKSLWNSRKLLAALAAAFAMQIFANYAEMVLYPLCAPLAFIALSTLRTRSLRTAVLGGFFLGFAFFLACLIAAPQIGPMVEFLPFSERAGKFDARFEMASMHPTQWLSLASPFLGGHAGYPNVYWASTSYEFWAGAIYFGLLPLLVVPFALRWLLRKVRSVRLGSRNHAAFFGLALVAAGALLASGMHTPLYALAYEYVPGFSRFRFPSKWLVIVILAAIPLIGAGWDAVFATWRKRNKSRLFPAIFAVEAIGGIALLVLAVSISTNPDALTGLYPSLAKLTSPDTALARGDLMAGLGWYFGALGLIAAAIFLPGAHRMRFLLPAAAALFALANLLLVARSIHPIGSDSTYNLVPAVAKAEAVRSPYFRTYSPYTEAQQYLYGNRKDASYLWAAEAGVGDTWLPFRIHQFWQGGPKTMAFTQISSAIQTKPELSERLADLISLKYVVTGRPWPEILWGNAPGEVKIQERPRAYPRIRFVSDWQPMASSPEVLASVLNGRFLKDLPKIEDSALVQGRVQKTKVPEPSGARSTIEPKVVSEDANSLVVETNSESDGFLIVGDVWYPGWRAASNGKELPIYRVEGLFRGIPVSAGQQTIRLSYLPNGFLFFCLISGAAMAFTAFCFFAGSFPSRRSANQKSR